MLSAAKAQLSEILSSFEFMDSETMRCVEENLHLRNPLNRQSSDFYLLIETAGSEMELDADRLFRFLEGCLERKLVTDGTVAADSAQAKAFWAIRERCTEALMHDGYVYKQDFSLPLSKYYEMTQVCRDRVGHLARRVIAYGHLGDGNLHLNITIPEYSKEMNSL